MGNLEQPLLRGEAACCGIRSVVCVPERLGRRTDRRCRVGRGGTEGKHEVSDSSAHHRVLADLVFFAHPLYSTSSDQNSLLRSAPCNQDETEEELGIQVRFTGKKTYWNKGIASIGLGPGARSFYCHYIQVTGWPSSRQVIACILLAVAPKHSLNTTAPGKPLMSRIWRTCPRPQWTQKTPRSMSPLKKTSDVDARIACTPRMSCHE